MADEDTVPNPEDARFASLLRKMANDPRTRRDAVKLIRTVDPDNFPESAFPDVKLAEIEEKFDGKFSELDTKQQTTRLERKLAAQKAKLLETYEEDQVAEMEKMVSEGLVKDYDTARKVYIADSPAPNPRNSPPPPRQGETWTMPDFKATPAALAKKATDGAYADMERLMRGERL